MVTSARTFADYSAVVARNDLFPHATVFRHRSLRLLSFYPLTKKFHTTVAKIKPLRTRFHINKAF